ncbi:hypothetical protein DPMN_090451, partial [Dreissena polymorpha]
ELEKPPPDPLYGLRVHSWVLILHGKREVPDSFFVEPFTGLSHPVDSPSYLGIESVWNHVNYWVNMQDCAEGVKNLSYDLGDCTRWEYMFPNTDKPLLQIPEAEDDILDGLDDEEENQDEHEKQLDLPPTWVEAIKISKKDFEMRCPQGKKNKLYKRAKLEKFAHYLIKDGLVSRLSIYSDRELQDLVMTREYFDHREDKLYNRVHNHQTSWITEFFRPGRLKCLKEHMFKANSPGPESDRTMLFYSEARVDGLMKRTETAKPKKFGPQDKSVTQDPRPILKMHMKYHRNKNVDANCDIAELMYLCSEDKVQITYHTEDKRIASSTREFIKPHNWDEKGATLTFSAEMHSTFQVDPNLPFNKQVELYEMLLSLLEREVKSIEGVRASEEEVREILDDRVREETTQELNISVYNTERNEKAKKHRQELERQQMEERMRKQELEIDYLAPFLAQIGDPEKITRQQAYKLKEDCLMDLKQRLIDKANLIQARFEKETQKLQKEQAWYQQHQVNMTKDDEETYLEYCSQAMFRIHILELRLNRHKDQAPHKYMFLEQTLRTDARLAEYF